ncbi:hypothetical protein HEK616_41420 [Streptomyces nigrescens]|uniref:Uncharacterized protein n=1 Tax=Streptomyces nigrescens TaxID=1920 RepID=A0ABN6R0M3_STRNI|nr:hypothetical protein HEK616_41420 [Streptomyces nigrescens]
MKWERGWEREREWDKCRPGRVAGAGGVAGWGASYGKQRREGGELVGPTVAGSGAW